MLQKSQSNAVFPVSAFLSEGSLKPTDAPRLNGVSSIKTQKSTLPFFADHVNAVVFLSQPIKRQTITLLSKDEKRDSKRLPNSANLSESLILSVFLYFIPCFVTEDIPSPHGLRRCRECPYNTGTNLPPQYTGTYRLGIQ